MKQCKNNIFWILQRIYDLARILDLGIISRSTYKTVTKTVTTKSVDELHRAEMDKTRQFVQDRIQSEEDGVRYITIYHICTQFIQKKVVHVIGDGQFDSRGFSATLHRYTIADHRTKLILDNEVVDKTETKGNTLNFSLIKFVQGTHLRWKPMLLGI